MCYYLTPLACGPGRQWPGGSKWCELWTVVVSSLSLYVNTMGQQGQPESQMWVSPALALSKQVCKWEHMHTVAYSQTHTHTQRGKYKQWHRQKTHIYTCMGLPLPRATYSAQHVQRLPPSSSLCLLFSLSLSLSRDSTLFTSRWCGVVN